MYTATGSVWSRSVDCAPISMPLDDDAMIASGPSRSGESSSSSSGESGSSSTTVADQRGVPAGTPKRSQSWILVRAATSLCVAGSCGVSGARHTSSTVPAARKPGRTNPSLLVRLGTVTFTLRSVPNKIGVRERT